MTRTKLFHSNRSHAMRLPKDLAFASTVKDVAIFRDGGPPGGRARQRGLGRLLRRPGVDIAERARPQQRGPF